MTQYQLNKVILFAVEGQCEQSFVRWLAQLCEDKRLSLHLSCELLGGVSYKSMFKTARLWRTQKDRSRKLPCIFLVDADCDGKNGNWSLAKLKEEAANNKMILCLQRPNMEGLLLRLFPEKENLWPRGASDALKQLKTVWPDYEKKTLTFSVLHKKFTLDDLIRVARFDLELENLLKIIGLL